MHDSSMRIETARLDPTVLASDDLSFRADAVMPAQFYPARRGWASVEPIMRLMAGILIDAVRCFQNNFEARHPSRRREFIEARRQGNRTFLFPVRVRLVGRRSAWLEKLDCSLAGKKTLR